MPPENYKYYEARLDKKTGSSKLRGTNWQKLWAVLQESNLYFYEFTGSISRARGADLGKIELEAATFTDKEKHGFLITCYGEKYHFRASNSEELEIWKAYLHVVMNLEIPPDLKLLPGFKNDLQQTIDQEKSRRKMQRVRPPCLGYCPCPTASEGFEVTHRFWPDHLQGLAAPPWFFGEITREQAEYILHNNLEKGDLLVRQKARSQYAISARYTLIQNGKKEMSIRHYIINKFGEFFELDIEESHPPVLNLYEMLNFFIEKSGGVMKPLVTNNPEELHLPDRIYERGLLMRAVDFDPDSGEWGPRPVPEEILLRRHASKGKATWWTPVVNKETMEPNGAAEDYLVPATKLYMNVDHNLGPVGRSRSSSAGHRGSSGGAGLALGGHPARYSHTPASSHYYNFSHTSKNSSNSDGGSEYINGEMLHLMKKPYVNETSEREYVNEAALKNPFVTMPYESHNQNQSQRKSQGEMNMSEELRNLLAIRKKKLEENGHAK